MTVPINLSEGDYIGGADTPITFMTLEHNNIAEIAVTKTATYSTGAGFLQCLNIDGFIKATPSSAAGSNDPSMRALITVTADADSAGQVSTYLAVFDLAETTLQTVYFNAVIPMNLRFNTSLKVDCYTSEVGTAAFSDIHIFTKAQGTVLQ